MGKAFEDLRASYIALSGLVYRHIVRFSPDIWMLGLVEVDEEDQHPQVRKLHVTDRDVLTAEEFSIWQK